MAKIPVKKTAAKKGAKPAAKKTVKSKSSPAKKTAKKPVTEKERELRAANLIANSEKKKK